MKMKTKAKRSITAFICIFALLFSLPLSGCANKSDDGKINVVCTLFPQYDWMRNIIGESESVELSLIIANGSDPHSYQPTAADVLKISECDMIVYMGNESDVWVSEALERANRPSILKVALCSLEGMTLHNISSHSHEHAEDSHEHHDHGHGTLDEHIWLSLGNAVRATEQLAITLASLDPDNAELYTENARKYIERLGELDNRYKKAVEESDAEHRFMLFADRFPFVYLLSDYGIDYQAAFEGCTTDVDADFDTVLTLIKEAERHGVKYVSVTESSDKALARTVVASAKHTEMEILTMNSMQAMSKKSIDDGATYLSVMEQNLSILKKAIGN